MKLIIVMALSIASYSQTYAADLIEAPDASSHRSPQSSSKVSEITGIKPLRGGHYFVCYGQSAAVCEGENGWVKATDLYISCGGSGRKATGAALCGQGHYGIYGVETRGGGRCGYDWYNITCH